jgi:hypothetical protein
MPWMLRGRTVEEAANVPENIPWYYDIPPAFSPWAVTAEYPIRLWHWQFAYDSIIARNVRDNFVITIERKFLLDPS